MTKILSVFLWSKFFFFCHVSSYFITLSIPFLKIQCSIFQEKRCIGDIEKIQSDVGAVSYEQAQDCCQLLELVR